MKTDVIEMLNQLLLELNELTIQIMTGDKVKPQSNLAKSIQWAVGDKGLGMQAAYYYPYVSEGRRRGTKKVPISALIDYIKRYGLTPRGGQTINQLAFAIQTAIYKRGLNPRGYADDVMEATGDLTQEEITYNLAEGIADELVNSFKI